VNTSLPEKVLTEFQTITIWVGLLSFQGRALKITFLLLRLPSLQNDCKMIAKSCVNTNLPGIMFTKFLTITCWVGVGTKAFIISF